MSKKKMKTDIKLLLVGNGFTSYLIKGYESKLMKDKLRSELPCLVEKVDSVWKKISATIMGDYEDINDLNYPYEVLDNAWLAIRDEEGIIPHSTHIEVDKLSRIKTKIVDCFVNYYGIDRSNAIKIFGQFFSKRSSILRFFVVTKEKKDENGTKYIVPEIDSVEAFYALVKLCFRLNVINQEEKNSLVGKIKVVLRNGECFYAENITKEGISVEGIIHFLNEFDYIFTTNYDQLLEVCCRDIIHLHGSFSEGDIILGIDDVEKQRKIKYTDRIDVLRSLRCSEIHVFGYSGRNDIHINDAVKENGAPIIFYCKDALGDKDNPSSKEIKNDELNNVKYQKSVKWSFGISDIDECDFTFKDREIVWNRIRGYNLK